MSDNKAINRRTGSKTLQGTAETDVGSAARSNEHSARAKDNLMFVDYLLP